MSSYNNRSTVYVGNLSEKVTEDLLFELFLQAGPVTNVNIPSDRGRPKPFGFVQFKHPSSVLYSIKLFEGTSLFGKTLRLNLPKGAVMPVMPMVPPQMGPPVMHRLDVQPKPLVHPLTLQGRLGPPVNSRSVGRRGTDVGRHEDTHGRQGSRRHDHMMPSSRPRKRREDPVDLLKEQLDSIPDFLGSAFDPLYPSGPQKPARNFREPSNHSRRRDHPYENQGSGQRFQQEPRRDRHNHYTSNKRRQF